MKIIGKKRNKIVTAVLFGIILLCFGNRQSVFAENTLQIGIDQYEVTESGEIQVYVNQNKEGAFNPSASESMLMIGKNKLGIKEIRTFSDTGGPVTYFCLVDISGSMTEGGISQTQEILKQFVDRKGKEDNLCIMTMGNDVSSSGFLSEKEALMDAIGEIERIGSEDTNLYYSITEALNVLKTDGAVHEKRCLLVFSDGEDDQKKGITEKEAEDAVKDGHIPVFTIALEGANLKDAEGSAKILGSFARISAGGEHYAPALDEECEYGEICGKITGRIQESLIVSAGLEDVKEIGDDTVYIDVTLSDGSEKASDGITVPAGNILEAIEKAQENADFKVMVINENGGADNSQSELPEVEGASEPSEASILSRVNKYVIVGITMVILVLILALVLIMRNREETVYEEEETDDGGYEEDDYSAHNGQASSYSAGRVGTAGFSESSVQSISGRASAEVGGVPVGSLRKGKDTVQVTLYKVGPGEAESYQINIKGEAMIGRNKSCQLSFENDTALSGKHCSILYRDGSLFVKDEESTNGTFINGIPVVGEYKVELDDILLIGSSEYRIVGDVTEQN